MSEKHLSEHATQFSIGKLIEHEANRDAIHIAVAPVTAGMILRPGQHVCVKDDIAMTGDDEVGIVDPFLDHAVRKGERFFLFLYPNTITSLNHLWTHPAFPTQEQKDFTSLMTRGTTMSASEEWLRKYAEEVGVSYKILLESAKNFADYADYHILNYDTPDIVYKEKDNFWKHYEVVTGTEVPEDKRGSVFSCSC